MPEDRGAKQRIHQHRPALVQLQQMLTVNVVEGERHRRQFCRNHPDSIEAGMGEASHGNPLRTATSPTATPQPTTARMTPVTRRTVGCCNRRATIYSSTQTGATYCSTIAVATDVF